MPDIRVRENEPIESALRRFKRACEKEGILTELRENEYYRKPTAERKRKKAAAVKRWAKKLLREMPKRETNTRSKDYQGNRIKDKPKQEVE